MSDVMLICVIGLAVTLAGLAICCWIFLRNDRAADELAERARRAGWG